MRITSYHRKKRPPSQTNSRTDDRSILKCKTATTVNSIRILRRLLDSIFNERELLYDCFDRAFNILIIGREFFKKSNQIKTLPLRLLNQAPVRDIFLDNFDILIC